MRTNRHVPFWLLTFGILTGTILPKLIQDGMFMDGMLYTSVSHNLSQGIGSFWFPQFSLHNLAGLSSLHEQPPLVFGIQALFFKLLGDSMYVERFYSFLTMCITAMLIIFVWKEIFGKQPENKKLGWLPLLLWISIPVSFWSYSNNMHENTMGIFTLCSGLFTYKAFRSGKYQFVLLVLSGFTIFLASLSKGIPGFFPIVLPFLYWLTTKKISFLKSVVQTAIIIFVPVVIYVVLYCFPDSKESLSLYFFERVLHRVSEVPTVDSRFYILKRLLMELIPSLMLVVIFSVVAKVKKVTLLVSGQVRESVFFIAVGLSASVPLMLTLVQKGFYFVPSLPFFAIGLSVFIAPIITSLTNRINVQSGKYKLFLATTMVLLVGIIVFSFMQKGKSSRNTEMLHDVYLIGNVVPRHTTISIPSEMWNDWDLQCYLIRYFNISLETGDRYDYFISDKTLPTDSLMTYKKIDIETVQFDLYKKQ